MLGSMSWLLLRGSRTHKRRKVTMVGLVNVKRAHSLGGSGSAFEPIRKDPANAFRSEHFTRDRAFAEDCTLNPMARPRLTPKVFIVEIRTQPRSCWDTQPI